MSKVSQLDKAIANLKAERDVLNLAIQKLETQISIRDRQIPAVTRTRKPRAGHPAEAMNDRILAARDQKVGPS